MFKKFLSFIFSLICTTTFSVAQVNNDFGWVPNKSETERFVLGLPVIYETQISELVAQDTHEDKLLYRSLLIGVRDYNQNQWVKTRNGQPVLRAYNQGPVGSCVGNATAACLSILNALECYVNKKPFEFTSMHSADASYGLARESGGLLGRNGDGCWGSAAAKSIKDLGTLYAIPYEKADNLTIANPDRLNASSDRRFNYMSQQYGYVGVGDALKQHASGNKAVSATITRSAESAWALIGNGYPINVCSNQGFTKVRDKEGVLKPSGTWNHSMAVIGRRTTSDGRRLFLIWNSWGDSWASGSYWEDMPEGSFFIEWSVMDRMLAQGDSFAYGGLSGFKQRTLEGLGAREYLGPPDK
jgi:hypothetical protein